MSRFDWVSNFESILNGDIKIEYSPPMRRLILENKVFPHICNKCGIDKWLGEDIILEIEHKDGDRKNNSKSNLELLCPNCHSQTKTYRKNRTNKIKKVISKEEILKCYQDSDNINQTLIKLELSNSGGNYKRVKKILEEYGEGNKSELQIQHNNTNKYEKQINLILKEEIDFSKKSWGVKVSKIINKSPQYSLKFVKTHLPYLIQDNKHKPKINKKLLLKKQILSSGIDFKRKGWRKEISEKTGKSTWYLKTFIESHLPEIWNICYKK
jgi:hypothetical protein